MSKAEKLRAKRSGEEPETALQIAEREAKAIRAKAKALRERRLESLGIEDLSRPAVEEAQAKVCAETGAKVARRSKTITPANHPHMELVIAEIENPLYSRQHDGANANPRKITALMNLRESPVAMMAAKGHLDAHHVLAALEFRRLFEALGGSGTGAFDYGREPVDGGGAREPITDRQVDAGIRLRECEAYLGRRPYRIVSKVAGEGVTIAAMGSSHRERTTLADYLRHALDDLSELWGMKTRKPGRRVAKL